MGIRVILNTHATLSISILAVLVGVTMAVAFWPEGRKNQEKTGRFTWASADDGASYFPTAFHPLPPFEHKGREAVWAHVVTDGQTPRVVYLRKLTPQAHSQMREMPLERARERVVTRPDIWLIKRPGESVWYPLTDQRAVQLLKDRRANEAELAPDSGSVSRG
jgi:hypothetical protein